MNSTHLANKNTVIKKKNREKEKILLDDFLSQLQADESVEVKESEPIAITDQVKEKMIKMMESYLANKDKITKLNAIKKEITGKISADSRDLTTMMKLYGLNELIIKDKKFTLEQTVRKKPLRKDAFKQVLSLVLDDQEKVDKVYSTAEEVSEEVVVEKLKCLKYKGD
jgi:hypothetical protein